MSANTASDSPSICSAIGRTDAIAIYPLSITAYGTSSHQMVRKKRGAVFDMFIR